VVDLCAGVGDVQRTRFASVERLVVATSSVAADEVKLAASTLPLVEPGTVSVVKGTTSYKRRASTPLAVARKAKLGRKEVSPSPIGSLDGEVSPSPIGSLDGGLPLGVLTFIGTCPVIFLYVLPLGFWSVVLDSFLFLFSDGSPLPCWGVPERGGFF